MIRPLSSQDREGNEFSVMGRLAFAEHFPGVGQSLFGEIHAAKHPGYFCHPAGFIQ